MVWIALALIIGMLVAPHLLRQSAVSPDRGVALWGAVLLLRAAVALTAGLLLVVYLPTTSLFQAISHWCIHAVLPLLASHLSLSGHQLWDAAALAPALFMAVSVFWASLGIWRGSRAVTRWVQARALGSGPGQSVVVDDPEVLLAAAGIRSPRLIVTTGALAALDADELRAGLEHEHGHIARRHRLTFATGQLLRSLASWLPGTKVAFSYFSLHLERDADQYAIERTRDPLALASAIGKAALAAEPAPAGLGLGGGITSERMRLLLAGPPAASRRSTIAATALTIAIALVWLGMLLSLPEVAQGATSVGADEPFQHVCPG